MPRPPGQTRERMMDEAEQLFHRHGFGGVSVEDVTSAVGVKKPDLYNHFRDKSELYTAVRLRRLHRLGEDLDRVLSVPAPFTDRLPAVVSVLLHHPYFLSALAQREAETFLPEDVRDLLFARAYGAVYRPLSRFLRETASESGIPESRIPFVCEALLGLAVHFAAVAAPTGRTAAGVAELWLRGAAFLGPGLGA